VIRARRLQRRFGILEAVIREPGLSPRQLASRSGISERTLSRDLKALRQLGYGIVYSDGYQVQESLGWDVVGAHTGRSLARVFEEQLQVLRDELPGHLAAQIEAEINALAPAALAGLFASVIEKRLNYRG
jgi:predicted DNA-binding transcriptional regulator YafY